MNNNTHPIAWSYSSLQKFKNCGKRYYEERVAKSVKQAPTEATTWGEDTHKAFEVALTTQTPLVGRFKNFNSVAEKLSAITGTFHAEQKLAINASLRPVEYFAPDVWCRGIPDAVWIDKDTAKIVDLKTGKRKKDSNQLRLFALLLFAHHPQVDRINTGFLWLQNGALDIEKFKREDIPIMWQEILPDVRRLEYAHRTQTWIPKPSGLCNYCPVTKCSFWRGLQGEGGQRRES